MMNFHILTLFPDMVMQGLHTSIIGRAVVREYISIEAVNIRDYTLDKHGKVDDYTYGGGAGMLMQAQPVYDACMAVQEQIMKRKMSGTRMNIGDDKDGCSVTPEGNGVTEVQEHREAEAVVARMQISDAVLPACDKKARVIYVSPQGRTFHQDLAKELAQEEDLIFLCGHYEGIDERVLEEIVTDEISLGDYVLTGGELPAMVMVDAIARLVPGVLHNSDSAVTESFYDGLLEYPQYSRPEVWHDKRVPSVLLSGDHARVDAWRLEQSILRTKERRPDLYEAYQNRMSSGHDLRE